ncbi:hypothetical protein LXL04_011158 [Taraxacum kok-saghyz]
MLTKFGRAEHRSVWVGFEDWSEPSEMDQELLSELAGTSARETSLATAKAATRCSGVQLSGRQLTCIFQRAPQVRAPLNEQTLTRRGFQGENFTTQWYRHVYVDDMTGSLNSRE